jgi:hypothetical protein
VRNERGSAFLLTVIICMVITVVAGTLVIQSGVETRQAQREEHDLQAYYLALSGADAVAELIMNKPQIVDQIIGHSTTAELGNGHFTAQVLEEDGGLRIVSTGVVKDASRVVELTLLTSSKTPEIKHAAFVGGSGGGTEVVKVMGSGRISGAVGTNAVHAGAISLGGSAVIDGDVFVGTGADVSKVVTTQGSARVTGRVGHLLEEIHYSPPGFPEFPVLPSRPNFYTPWKDDLDYRIEEDGHYDYIEVTSSRTLKIDVGGGERRIRVREINIQGDVELINVGENGRLILYVDETFSTSGNRKINYRSDGVHDPATLTIYYAGANVFGNEQFNLCGNLVVKNAPVKITGSSAFRGSIFSGGDSVSVSGSASTLMGLIYAPDAAVEVLGSGVTHAVVSKSLTILGSARVEYDETIRTDYFPPGVLTGGGGQPAYTKGYYSSGQSASSGS